MSHAVYEDMLMKITSLLFAAALAAQADAASSLPPPPVPVSYTHLTLPTTPYV